jgi:hypothetical protein
MLSWLPELFTAIIIGAATFLFPHKSTPAQSQLSYAELAKRYQKWEWFAIIPLSIFLPLLTILFTQIFQAQYKWEIDDNPRIIYQLLPEEDWWAVPGMMIAFALIGIPMIPLYKAIFKERYAEYILFTNLKHHYDGMKVFKPMCWLFGVTTLVSMFLMTDYYIKIWPFKIEINELMGTKIREYSFNQIKTITYVAYSRQGNVLTENPHYHITFKNNFLWDTSIGLHDQVKQPEIVAYLSDRSGVKVDTLGVDAP